MKNFILQRTSITLASYDSRRNLQVLTWTWASTTLAKPPGRCPLSTRTTGYWPQRQISSFMPRWRHGYFPPRGFLTGRPMHDNILEMDYHAQMSSLEHPFPILILFDFNAAFTLVQHEFMWKVLEALNTPPPPPEVAQTHHHVLQGQPPVRGERRQAQLPGRGWHSSRMSPISTHLCGGC